MLDYALEMLARAGIKRTIICVKYLGDQIREWFEANPRDDMEVLIPDIDPKDTADAVRQCADLIHGNFVVTMADIVTNLDLSAAMAYHSSVSPLVTICLKPVEQPGQFGLTMIDNDSRIHLFLEKPRPQELLMTTLTFLGKDATLHMHHNLANIGIYVCDYAVLEILETFGDLMDFGKHVFPFLLDHKRDVRGYLSEPYWMDAGTIEKYLWACFDVLRAWAWPYVPKEHKSAEQNWISEDADVSPQAMMSSPVQVGKGARIEGGSQIGPNVVIGENVIISAGARIHDSVIWDNSQIGEGARIEDTVLAKSVIVKPEVQLTRSVVPSGTQVNDSNMSSFSWK